MIMDKNLELADATALTTGTTASTIIGDVVDKEVASRIGDGESLFAVIQVTTAVTSGTSGTTVAFSVSHGSADTLGTDVATSQAIVKDDLTIGKQIVIPMPSGVDYGRYVGVRFVSSHNLTAGAVNCFITGSQPSDYYSTPDATN